MKTTRALRELGQSIWLDNITRQLLDSGTLQRYIDELDVTGLTSNPTIFDKAIGASDMYDSQIADSAKSGATAEDTFFQIAISDLRRAADLFRPTYERTNGVDGYVSLEVSPLIAYDTATTTSEAKRLSELGDRPNLYIKIPGTAEGNPSIEASIFAGVPINVTLLFSPAQTLASAEAYTRGIERRLDAGKSPNVESVASLFVSRWDPLTADRLPDNLQLQLGLAIGQQTYAEYTEFFASERWRRLKDQGARPQRLLFASTGVKDPSAPKELYVLGLAAPDTVDTMPEDTLHAVGDLEQPVTALPTTQAELGDVLKPFRDAGIDIDATALELQEKGAEAFVKSWSSLLERISGRVAAVV
jgi:transaldolase